MYCFSWDLTAFLTIWFPAIVCGVGGCLLSWLIGYRQGKRLEARGDASTRMLTTALVALELQGVIELERRPDGSLTGGYVLRRSLGAQTIRFGGEPAKPAE